MIDTHQHFWKFTPEEFGWLEGDMAKLRRDFLPTDLQRTLSGTDVTSVISVQARRTDEETDWLLQMAEGEEFIQGVVGWVALKDEAVGTVLDRLVGDPKFKGVREITQGAHDAEYLLNPDFDRGIRELTKRSITYDLLIFHDQLPAAIRFVQRHPEQIFIVDHIAKPAIRLEFAANWAREVRLLAAQQNVYCKFSGVATEVREPEWNLELLQPYFDVVWEAFGSRRLMFGSDWPVCLARVEYRRWIEVVEELLAEASPEERRQFFQTTAEEAYRL